MDPRAEIPEVKMSLGKPRFSHRGGNSFGQQVWNGGRPIYLKACIGRWLIEMEALMLGLDGERTEISYEGI